MRHPPALGFERLAFRCRTDGVDLDGSDHKLLARLYDTAREHVAALLDALQQTLRAMGCGPNANRRTFETEVRRALVTLATAAEDAPPLAQLRVDGTGEEKRRTLIGALLRSLGADEAQATRTTTQVLNADPNLVAIGAFDQGLRVRQDAAISQLNAQLAAIFVAAQSVYRRLDALAQELGRPYAQQDGLDQAFGTLRRFPDLAAAIYGRAGITGLTSFPPARHGAPNADGLRVERLALDWVGNQATWEMIAVAGLIIGGVALSVISAATLSPLLATLAGSGVGLALGGAVVGEAATALRNEQDAYALGGASAQRVAHARGELAGAWAGLVVGIATGGALAHFGGNAATPMLTRMVRVTALSGAGGGLATATNPNTYAQQSPTATIVLGTLVGGAGAVGGMAVAGGVGRIVPPLGTPVQFGASRIDGPLRPGGRVRVAFGPDDPAVAAQVVTVSSADRTVTLQLNGSPTVVKVGRALKVEGSLFDQSLQRRAIRPAKLDDFVVIDESGRRSALASVTRNGLEFRGVTTANDDGTFDMVDSMSLHEIRGIELSDLRILDTALYARLAGIPEADLNALGKSSWSHSIAAVPDAPGYYIAHGRQESRRLSIVPGPTRDSNRAFAAWFAEDLPSTIDMRGRGPAPQVDEVALFGAHGTRTGFLGLSTRQAARTVADAIVTLNDRTPGQRPLRCVQLSSCQQGSRRFLVLGKTNAESFQDHLNQRLRELGVDPLGRGGITVLAADRSGSLFGVDQVLRRGRLEGTAFVPAGTQRPLAYRNDNVDLVRAGIAKTRTLVGTVLLPLGATQAALIVGFESLHDPQWALRWIANVRDRALGWIFEAPEADH